MQQTGPILSSSPCNIQGQSFLKTSEMWPGGWGGGVIWDSRHWQTVRYCIVKVKFNHAAVVQPRMLDCNTGMTTKSQRVQRTHEQQMDDKLLGGQAIYPSSIQLTCGGNIVKGVHDKKPISLTPWLALKTFWATDCKTVKKQQMTQERRENRMGENAHVFFWKKKKTFFFFFAWLL